MANHAWSYVADYILVTILVFVSSIFFSFKFFLGKTCSENLTLRQKCPNTEFFWSVFSPNTGQYGPENIPYLNFAQG